MTIHTAASTPSVHRNRTALLFVILGVTLAWANTTASANTVHTDISKVYACQPRAGSVFAATDGGLALFDLDGAPRRVYTELDGLAGTRSYALLFEEDILWIGGEGGLTQARPSQDNLEIIARHGSLPIRTLTRHEGVLYAGTWGGGLERLSDGGLASVVVDQDGGSDLRVTDIVEYRGSLIVATAGQGMYRLVRNRLHVMNPAALSPRSLIWSLLVHEGRLLVGTATGLWEIGPERALKLADGDIRDLTEREGAVIATSFGGGLMKLEGQSLAAWSEGPGGARHGYSYNHVSGAILSPNTHSAAAECVASHHGLWLRGAHQQTWRDAQSRTLPSGDISAVAMNQGDLWVGTFDSGLAVWRDDGWQSFEHARVDPKINALVASDGRLWVGTSGGLSIIDGDRVTRVTKRDGLPSNVVLSLAPLRHGGMLIGTAHGAAVMRDGAITTIGRKSGLYVGNIWAVREDVRGRMLLGTTKGLYRVADDMSFERFSVASGHLTDDWVMAIESIGDTLWIGTYKGGVTRLEPEVENGANAADPAARTLPEGGADGFSATHLGGGFINPHGLAWHDGRLYAATMDGLLSGDGNQWNEPEFAAPGRDTTAVLVDAEKPVSTLWIASRRGLRTIRMPAYRAK